MNKITEFKECLVDKSKSPNTIETYLRNIRAYLKFLQLDNEEEFNELHRVQIREYITYLNNIKKNSPNSINNKLSSLMAFNKFLLEKKYQSEIVINDGDFFKIHLQYSAPAIPKTDDIISLKNTVLNKKTKKQNITEYQRFLNYRDYCLITILQLCGVRISECIDLLIQDAAITEYEQDGNPLNISINAELFVRSGKGNKTRKVIMRTMVKEALKEYLKVRNLGNRKNSDSPYLFFSRESKKLTRFAVNKIFNKHGKDLSPHDLRHHMLSELMNSGTFTPQEVQSLSGHQNIQTLMLYTHPSVEEMRNKMDDLDRKK